MNWMFDGENKIIKEPLSSETTTIYDVKNDIYSPWKRWVLDNPFFLSAFIVKEINDIIVDDNILFILTNGWKIVPSEHKHTVIINGNLFSDDGIVFTINKKDECEVIINSSIKIKNKTNG